MEEQKIAICLNHEDCLKPVDIFQEQRIKESITTKPLKNDDLIEYDRVEINPEAIRLGLTKRKDIEKNSVPLPQQTSSLPIPPPVKVACVPTISSQNSKDQYAFGISYQAIRLPQGLGDDSDNEMEESSYSLPTGPAFEDEAEFERQLKSNQSSGFVYESKEDDDEDDEFEYDFEVTNKLNVPDLQTHLGASHIPSDADIISQMKAEVATATQNEKIDEEKFSKYRNQHNFCLAEVKNAALTQFDVAIGEEISDLSSLYAKPTDEVTSMPKSEKLTVDAIATDLSKELETLDEDEEDEEEGEGEEEEDAEEEDEHEDTVETEPLKEKCEEDSLKESINEDSQTVIRLNSRKVPAPLEFDENDWDDLKSLSSPYADDVLEVISFNDAISHFSTPKNDVQNQKKSHWSFPFMRQPLENVDTVIDLSKIGFEWGDPFHRNLLCTVYIRLTCEDSTSGTTGQHWERIGFQGSDPSTDLRGAGCLGLLQMIWLAEKYPEVIRHAYCLSQDAEVGFPLMSVSLNFSLCTLKRIRRASSCQAYLLDSSNPDAIIAACMHFAGLWKGMVELWRTRKHTVYTFSTVLHKLEKRSTKSLISALKKQYPV